MDWSVRASEWYRIAAPNQGLFPSEITALAATNPNWNRQSLSLPILSHLPTRLDAQSPVIASLTACINDLAAQKQVLSASVGLSCWELPLTLAQRSMLPAVVFLPPVKSLEETPAVEVMRQLAIDPGETILVQPLYAERIAANDLLHCRDKLVASLARNWYPIAVRERGYWHGVLQYGAKVNRDYQVSFTESEAPPKFASGSVSTEANKIEWPNYLVHQTRGSFGPWPGERRADYYRSLLDRKVTGNPRDAEATLSYIINSGILRASDRASRHKRLSLSFTSLTPFEYTVRAIHHPALHQKIVEPFGIAVPKVIAASLGARPVIYGDDQLFATLDPGDRPYFQAIGRGKSEHTWADEAEWRLIGDLDLASIEAELIFFAPSEQIAEHVSQITGRNIIALYRD